MVTQTTSRLINSAWTTLVALALLGVAGIVIAMSWLVSFPGPVLIAAWLVALVAMVAVFVSAFQDARRSGRTVRATLRHSLKGLGSFLFWFF